MSCCGGSARTWAFPGTGPGQQGPRVLYFRWGYQFWLKYFLLRLKIGYFPKPMNLFLRPEYMSDGGWWQSSAPIHCDTQVGCNICPFSEGCCLWELRLRCEWRIIKRNLATEERALRSIGAQQFLPYLYDGAISLKCSIIYLQQCQVLSRIV